MKYIVQLDRQSVPDIGLDQIDRLDVKELLDSFVYPVVWRFDEYLNCWLPAEISESTALWLRGNPYGPYSIDGTVEEYPQQYHTDLLRAGLFYPTGRIPLDGLFVKRRLEGSVKIPSLFNEEYVSWIRDYYARIQMIRWPDMQGISRISINDHALMRLIHVQLVPILQAILARQIKASYSFTATYDNKSSLPKHTDRPQCVYNVSLLFGGVPANVPLGDWPLYVEANGMTHVHRLKAGDAALYYGTKHLHWREKMPPSLETVTGAFLHYVPLSFTGSLK